MSYFYYTISPASSGWDACKSTDKPAEVSPEGRRRKIVQLTQLPADQEKLTLKELSDIYPMSSEHV